MEINDVKYSQYLQILREELLPAMGCTEPIALAYASARGREVLGKMPERIDALCSGNMIKNVRCVTIPNSGGHMPYVLGLLRYVRRYSRAHEKRSHG